MKDMRNGKTEVTIGGIMLDGMALVDTERLIVAGHGINWITLATQHVVVKRLPDG